MKVEKLSLLDGARKAKGTAVIIDVFRASSAIVTMIAGEAEYIIPLTSVKTATTLKIENPELILFGEVNGIPPHNYFIDNSPSYCAKNNLKNKGIALMTSAGTKGIYEAKNADEVLIGCFLNAAAIADHIKSKNPETVSLVAIGENGVKKAVEDEICSEYLASILSGKKTDFQKMKKQMLKGEGAARLRRLDLRDDLVRCLMLDRYDVVPRLYLHAGLPVISSVREL